VNDNAGGRRGGADERAARADGRAEAGSSGQAPARSAPRLAKLRILGKEVTIACAPEEEAALGRAAAYVDGSMRDLKSRNATSSLEKIAIVTAINTADALLRSRDEHDDDGALAERVGALNETLQQTLASVAQERRELAGPPAVPDVTLDPDERDT